MSPKGQNESKDGFVKVGLLNLIILSKPDNAQKIIDVAVMYKRCYIITTGGILIIVSLYIQP